MRSWPSSLSQLTTSLTLALALSAVVPARAANSPPRPQPKQAQPTIANLITHPAATLQGSPSSIRLLDGSLAPSSVRLSITWNKDRGSAQVANLGSTPVAIREIVLFDLEHRLPPETSVYAESFQMLAQISGTLQKPTDIGEYPDRSHYRLDEPAGFRTAYGVLTLAPDTGPRVLLGFTSCKRFSGRFHFNGSRLQVAIDTEGLTLHPKESWALEEFIAIAGHEREPLFDSLAKAIRKNHKPIFKDPPPTGWCSWYHFGPKVTAADVAKNLDWMSTNMPELRYVQIDDGYQPHMGDWLDTGKAFGGNVREVLLDIKRRGFEPAIWVAPFIADANSKLFQEHPDWFVKDASGKPLRSDTVGFGGWRMGPWYCLDGTHPAAQAHLTQLFKTMREEWGCTYFKLDANYWGAIHKGFHHDPKATRIEAYRRGMQAILAGSKDAFILGCNHPIWPSLGLIHGSRSSNDISRNWGTMASTARENLLRGWQNGRLWWNDPDCVLLTGKQPENEFQFHAAHIFATGGMLLNGDDLPALSPARSELLHRLCPPTGKAMEFQDENLTLGVLHRKGSTLYAAFNWTNQPRDERIPLQSRSRIRDFLTQQDLGEFESEFPLKSLAPRSARVIEIIPAATRAVSKTLGAPAPLPASR